MRDTLKRSLAGIGKDESGSAGSSSHASDITSYSWSEDLRTDPGDAVAVANRLELRETAYMDPSILPLECCKHDRQALHCADYLLAG